MEDNKWLDEYYLDYKKKIITEEAKENMIKAKEMFLELRKSGNRAYLAGNGASCLISAHGALDFINQLGIKATPINEANFLTAAANDFGYEDIFERKINLFAEPGDIVVLISCSGKSKNVINAGLKAKELGCRVITFTGFDVNNPLKTIGDINFWVNSDSYNVIESVHNNWIVTICDLILKDELDKVGVHGLEF